MSGQLPGAKAKATPYTPQPAYPAGRPAAVPASSVPQGGWFHPMDPPTGPNSPNRQGTK